MTDSHEVPHPLQILLAEDDPDDQTLFCAAAAKTALDLHVHIVGHGQGVIEYLEGVGGYADRKAHPLPDVLVLDLRMPILDGFEVLSWCQASPVFCRLPVVVLSGAMDENWRGRALDAGARRFFLKAFHLAGWTAMVRQIEKLARGNACPPREALKPELARSP